MGDYRGNCPELMVSGPHVYDEDYLEAELPHQWARDGQCLIRNHLFHLLHGYNENHKTWGGESYDLYLRATNYGARVASYDPSQLHVMAHGDNLRMKHMSAQFEGDNGREVYYRRSHRKLRNMRRLDRTTPGRMPGFHREGSAQVQVFRRGKLVSYRPGEE
jgi:hypothetical protein